MQILNNEVSRNRQICDPLSTYKVGKNISRSGLGLSCGIRSEIGDERMLSEPLFLEMVLKTNDVV